MYKKNGKNNRNYYAFILIREDEQGFRADEACGILKKVWLKHRREKHT